MAKNNQSLFDECLDADSCEIVIQFCTLIDLMLKDIQHLEAECVRTRFRLSLHLESPYDEYLQSDILSNLGMRYQGNPAYQLFTEMMYAGGDPMEFREWSEYLFKVAHGQDDHKY